MNTRSYYRKESAASPQGIKGSMHNLLNKGDDFNVHIEISHGPQLSKKHFLEIDYS